MGNTSADVNVRCKILSWYLPTCNLCAYRVVKSDEVFLKCFQACD